MLLELDVFGDVQVSRDLLRLGDRAVDATPAFRQILAELADHEREQFDSSGRHGSGGWEPLTDATKAAKAASPDPTVRSNAEKVLKATEALYDSLTGRDDGGDAIRHASDDTMIFGTSVPYARFHQLGEGVPQRRPVELADRHRAQLVKTLQRYVLTGEL